MRCGRCGNENGEANRFCGMCGAALVAKDQAEGQEPQPGALESGGRSAEGLPATGSSSDDRSDAGRSSWPVISGGPSLLGLNLPATETGSGRGDRHSDGHDPLRPSSNVDYLLDDEEPRRSWGKVILVVAALGLAVGFGYLHWKRGGFDWLSAGDKKPTAAMTQTPDAGQSGADSGGAAANAGGAAPPPASGAGTTPAANPAESAAQTAAPQPASQAAPTQSDSAQNSAPQSAVQEDVAPQGDAGNSGAPAGAGSHAADADSGTQSAPAGAMHRAVSHKPAAVKPAAAKPAVARPVDSVTEAERYIYGRGVVQDCDHGLRLLKPAAQSNVKAMISLGTLYTTGTCTPRDLPTAYRWFALALHKEPDNQALQNNLQNLWSTMTPPERQLAIKLSQ